MNGETLIRKCACKVWYVPLLCAYRFLHDEYFTWLHKSMARPYIDNIKYSGAKEAKSPDTASNKRLTNWSVLFFTLGWKFGTPRKSLFSIN